MLNFDNEGKNIAMIKEKNKKKNKIVSVLYDNDTKNKFNKLTLKDGQKFQQIPDKNTERNITYIVGPSGSGKSTYARNYIKEYKKMFKNNDIYIFSALKEDENLDDLFPKRIIIDDRLVSDPLEASDFKDSLILFDDISVIRDKHQRKAVYQLLDEVLEIGRHHKISCLLTNHMPTAGNDTKRVLNETHCVVYFPNSGNNSTLKRLLTEIIGIDVNTFNKIKRIKSRWCCIFKNFPQIAMTENKIWALSDDD